MGDTNNVIGQDIGLYANRLLQNKNLKVGQELKASDGGTIDIFVNAQGETVGSINKDANGKIRNVAFEDKKEESSYNDVDKNGKIDSIFTKKEDSSKNGQNIDNLSLQLANNKNLKVGQEIKAGDGGSIDIFVNAQGKEVGSINKDARGKIRNVSFEGKNEESFYNDMDKNGTIDNGIVKKMQK